MTDQKSDESSNIDHVRFDRKYIIENLPPLFKLAAPIAITYLIKFSTHTITLMVVGRIDGQLLGSCALAYMM
jgi:Na+-driven multidrug efflux pump